MWFARHEIRLALRDWIRTGKVWRVTLSAAILAIIMHGVGYALALVVPLPDDLVSPGAQAIMAIVLSFGLVSILAMMTAQAMEAVTRAFYVRGDLELILSSPASARRLFAVRMGAITLTTLSLVGFLVLPFVNMLALINDWHWLSIYGVLIALATLAQAVALMITVGLFRFIGPRRTRLVSQIVAAVIGAVTVIGTQVPVILHSGTMSRLEFLTDPTMRASLPGPSSLVWLPAHAAHGDVRALAILLVLCMGGLSLTVIVCSRNFAEMVVAAAGISQTRARLGRDVRFARRTSPIHVLRKKELQLILRDPWLVSQSLMQIFYLIPPALLLWRNFGEAVGSIAVLVPVIVMASGQLAGGLAWLAISAEDAPELIATAPLRSGLALRAKVEAVMLGVGAIVGPILVGIAFAAPMLAIVGVIFSILAIGSNTYVQFVFRSGARRSQFRLRQRSSRMATLSETFCSISWAAASGLAASGNVFFLVPAVAALGILALCGWFAPARAA
jgi:ABC-2 type transport system permease protein